MELRARGWSVAAAARGVGVSRSCGANWSRGYKVYRRGRVVGFVPPLDRLAVKQISARYLSQDERIEMADLHRAGLGIRQIARRIGRAPSTISRELRRNGRRDGGYRPFDAHRRATARRARNHRRRLDTNRELRELVGALLSQRWSPQQIARHLRARFPDDPGMRLCHESIYQALYQPGSTLVRPFRVSAALHRSPLRSGRDHRRAHQRTDRRRPRFEQPVLSVHQRPFAPDDRTQAGHWEGDPIVEEPGLGHRHPGRAATRMIRLLHLPARDADALHAAIIARIGDLPASPIRSITWDQGIEKARHIAITANLGATVYFCDSHSPWQRGSNENANGLLRQYFRKGTNLNMFSPQHLQAVEDEINNRPRLILNDRTPDELFAALLASPNQPLLRR